DRNPELACFSNSNALFARIDDEDRVRHGAHIFNAAEEFLEALLLFLKDDNFFLRQKIECTVLFHALKLLQTGNPLLDRFEVRERTAEPALVNEELTAALCFFSDGILCLLLRADEQNRTALFC